MGALKNRNCKSSRLSFRKRPHRQPNHKGHFFPRLIAKGVAIASDFPSHSKSRGFPGVRDLLGQRIAVILAHQKIARNRREQGTTQTRPRLLLSPSRGAPFFILGHPRMQHHMPFLHRNYKDVASDVPSNAILMHQMPKHFVVNYALGPAKTYILREHPADLCN